MKNIELNVFTNSTISSPSTEMIENTVLSFNNTFGNNITTKIWCDPSPYLDNADFYVKNLKKIFPLVYLTESLSDGYVRAVKESDSDFIFMLEHDWEFLPTINHSLADIISLIYIEEITHFRFNKRANISRKFDLDLREVKHPELSYCLTNGVRNNTHIIDRRKYIDEALCFVEIRKKSEGIEKQLSNQGIRAAIYGGKNYPATILHKDGKRYKNFNGTKINRSSFTRSVAQKLSKLFNKSF